MAKKMTEAQKRAYAQRWRSSSSSHSSSTAAKQQIKKMAAIVTGGPSRTNPSTTIPEPQRDTPSPNRSSYDPYAAQRAAAAKAAAEKKAREKKEADATKKAVAALHSQLSKLSSSRKQAIANIDLREKEGRALIDKAFLAMTGDLERSYLDNQKAEHDTSYANRANRGRERSDILLEAASQGAGETDNLRAQAMAVRNWAANQGEINRSFHDTQTSISGEVTTLNETTKQNLHNLYGQSNVDRSKAWDDYYKSTADVWSQIFNAENSMAANDQYKVQYKDAGKKAADAVGGKWKDPGIPDEIKEWQGMETQEHFLNTSNAALQAYGTHTELKRPEGATLRKW